MSHNESSATEPALPPDALPSTSAPAASAPSEAPADQTDDPNENPPAPSASPGGAAALREWLTRSEAIAAAKNRLTERPARVLRMLERARLAEEGAERALNPVDPFRNGPGVSLALSLYREALYWGLLAQAQPEAEAPADLPAVWKQARRELLGEVATSAEQLEAIERGLVGSSFAETAELTFEQQRELAWQARPFVGALLERAEGGERELGRLRLQRWVRSLLAVAATAALVVALVMGIQRLTMGPDLAAGKLWKASSVYRNFDAAAHVCDGISTNIIFHTNEEESPWFEIDLGAPTQVGSVELHNRSDSLQERAVPLVVEVSDDRQKWTEVARRNDTFSRWRGKFSPRTARYVRVRVLRRTFFHLEGVKIRAK